jgi:hypothetical protein
MLGAIKGATSKLVIDAYGPSRIEISEGLRRMGPQLVAHLLIIPLSWWPLCARRQAGGAPMSTSGSSGRSSSLSAPRPWQARAVHRPAWGAVRSRCRVPAGATEYVPATYGGIRPCQAGAAGTNQYRFSAADGGCGSQPSLPSSRSCIPQPVYKVAESVLVGVSATTGWWWGSQDVLVPS